jgi:prolyl-tRNA synthetase
MGVIAEKFGDDKGLVWSDDIAPYRVHLVSIGDVTEKAQALYDELWTKGIEVLWDDRDMRPGEKFADADLIGIPHRVVVSEKNGEQYEYKKRTEADAHLLTRDELFAKL